MILVILAAAAIACAWQASRVRQLLPAALWLAGLSASTSMLLYRVGARQAAVIELSVGAGLVFVLFVFAINLTGDVDPSAARVPRPVAWTLVGFVLLLLGELAWPRVAGLSAVPAAPLSTSLWSARQLDVLLQIGLIFMGALTIAGLLGQTASAAQAHRQKAAQSWAGTLPLVTPSRPSSLRRAEDEGIAQKVLP